MFINTTSRTSDTEIMDDFQLEGNELKDALDKIAKINKLLGGNRLTLQGVKALLKNKDKTKEITIIDVGCGNGDMLRYIANYGEIEGFKFKLLGIDANAYTINYAKELSIHYPTIQYNCMDIFNAEFGDIKCDITLCTLTLHHFKDEEIMQLLSVFKKNSSIGIVINDLHRSKLAHALFRYLCYFFKLNKMSREDGLISILRGFKKPELDAFSKKLNLTNYTIKWKWAFRYQWIINKS